LEQQFAKQFERFGFDRDTPAVDHQRPIGLVEDATGEGPAPPLTAIAAIWTQIGHAPRPSEILQNLFMTAIAVLAQDIKSSSTQ
jgi:hypothetical protein